MRYSKILLCWMICGLSIVSRAQVINGLVQGENGERIEFASLVLWDKQGEQMLHFTTTDQLGRYELIAKKLEGILIASSLGFQADTVVLNTIPENQPLRIDFQLDPATFDLQSVEVSDSRIPYKTTGDTVTYQSEFFSDGTEQFVEDLVKKLPGASVSDDGTIYYKGKQVDKVLLEDDELFGRKYTIATRSLRADVVDEIQFIDHYVENHLLKDMQQSDQLAMNISIKEDRKKLLFGDGMLGGGVPKKYESRLNLFSLYKKHKAVFVGNAENTAGSPLDMASLFRDGLTLDQPYEYNRTADYIVRLPSYWPFELKKEEIKNGNIYQAASNIVLNPSEKLKIRSFGLGYSDQWHLDKRSFFRDLNLGDRYEYQDHSYYHESNRGLEWNVETLWQISARSNLKYNFNVSNNIIGAQAAVMVSLPRQDSVWQLLQNQGVGNAHRLNWVGKLNDKKVLVLDGAYLHNRKIQDFRFQPDEIHQTTETGYGQTNEHIVRDADLLASLLGKSGPLKYALSLKYRIQTDRLEASSSANSLLSQDLEFEDHFQNDYRQHFLALIGSFSTRLGITRLFSKLELGYRKASFEEQPKSIILNTEFYPNFQSGIEVQLNKKTTLLINSSVKSGMPESDDLISGPVWTSYRSILLGADQIDPFLNYSGVLILSHSNNARLLECAFNMMYTNNSRAYLDRYFYDGIFGVRTKWAMNGGHSWSANGDLDKYLPGLFANVGLTISGSVNRSFLISSETLPNEVALKTGSIELSYTTVYDGPLNFGISAEQTWNEYNQLSSAGEKSQSRRSGLNYFFTLKPVSKLLIKLTTRQVFTSNQEQPTKTIYLGRLRSEYQLNSGFRLSLNVYNLWNTRVYNLENFNGESYNFQQWRLNPRMFILSIGFHF